MALRHLHPNAAHRFGHLISKAFLAQIEFDVVFVFSQGLAEAISASDSASIGAGQRSP